MDRWRALEQARADLVPQLQALEMEQLQTKLARQQLHKVIPDAQESQLQLKIDHLQAQLAELQREQQTLWLEQVAQERAAQERAAQERAAQECAAQERAWLEQVVAARGRAPQAPVAPGRAAQGRAWLEREGAAPPSAARDWTAPPSAARDWTAPPLAGLDWTAPPLAGLDWTAPPLAGLDWTAPPSTAPPSTAPPSTAPPSTTQDWAAQDWAAQDWAAQDWAAQDWAAQGGSPTISDDGDIPPDEGGRCECDLPLSMQIEREAPFALYASMWMVGELSLPRPAASELAPLILHHAAHSCSRSVAKYDCTLQAAQVYDYVLQATQVYTTPAFQGAALCMSRAARAAKDAFPPGTLAEAAMQLAEATKEAPGARDTIDELARDAVDIYVELRKHPSAETAAESILGLAICALAVARDQDIPLETKGRSPEDLRQIEEAARRQLRWRA